MPSPAPWRIGPGPVFAYERLTASRRWQGYALRSVFLLLLWLALVVVWSGPRQALGRSPSSIAALAALGQWFFIAVVGTQLTLVLLIAPAATAGAICLDRIRGTLTHMLMTDLSNAEIVLGKLAARLVPVLGLVGCTLPLLAILTLLGGVDPNALLGAFLITLGIGLLGSAWRWRFRCGRARRMMRCSRHMRCSGSGCSARTWCGPGCAWAWGCRCPSWRPTPIGWRSLRTGARPGDVEWLFRVPRCDFGVVGRAGRTGGMASPSRLYAGGGSPQAGSARLVSRIHAVLPPALAGTLAGFEPGILARAAPCASSASARYVGVLSPSSRPFSATE